MNSIHLIKLSLGFFSTKNLTEIINISEFVNQFERTLSVHNEDTISKISTSLERIGKELGNINQKLSSNS